MTFHLTRKAKEDLLEIAIYTEETWGVKQRDIYLKQIDDTFHLIAKSPNKGRSCDYLKQGYYKYPIGKHLIFYRQFSPEEIQITRILHVSIDIADQLNS